MLQGKVLKNYIYNVLFQILNIILPIITAPYIARVLNPEGVGRYNYTLSVVSTFVLVANLGSASYGTRNIAYIRDDKKQLTKLFWEIVLFRAITTGLVLCCYLFMVFNSEREYQKLYLIQTIVVLSVAIDISWLFRGCERFKETVIRSAVVRLISVILMFVFIKTPQDVDKYCMVVSIPNFLGALCLWGYLPNIIGKNESRLFILKHLKPSLVFFLPAAATYIYTSVDKILLGIISTEAEVGFYSQSEKIVKLVITIITSLGTVMMPRVSNLIKKQSWDTIEPEIVKAFKFVGMLAFPLTVGLAMVSEIFVPVFFGPGYEKSIVLMQMLSILAIIIGFASITGSVVLIPLGRQNKYIITVVIGSTINIVLNCALIPSLQSIGASLSTIVAEATVTSLQFFFLRDKLNFVRIIKAQKNYVCATLLMALTLVGIHSLYRVSWVSVILISSLGAIVYFVILAAFKDEMIVSCLDRISKKIRK